MWLSSGSPSGPGGQEPRSAAGDEGKVDALFHLTGVKPSESRVHTVGAGEAIARLRKLDVLPSDDGLDDLIELRNGVAHSTQGDEGRELLPALVRTIEALLTDLGKDVSAFWERWTETIRLALDEARTELERDVRMRIQKARNVFQDRFEGLPDDAVRKFQDTQRNSFAMALMGEADHLIVEDVATCPACDGRAKVIMQGWDAASNSKNFVVNGFRCPMCHLTLTGAEEFTAAGLDLGTVNNDVVSELMRMLTDRSVASKAQEVRLGETRPG